MKMLKNTLILYLCLSILLCSAGSALAWEASKDLAGTKISFLNSKGEGDIPNLLEQLAAEFESDTGIEMEIIPYSVGEAPYTKYISMLNSGTPPTIVMLDIMDVIALSEEKAADLSGEEWLSECTTAYSIGDAVYGFPFNISCRDIIFNKAAIEKTLGEAFDPNSIQCLNDFSDLLQKLRENGMENPVVFSNPDWLLGTCILNNIYITYDGTTEGSEAVMEQLKKGEMDVAGNGRFQQMMDTIDLMLEYNLHKADPLGAIYDEDAMYLVDGECAFWVAGEWGWQNMSIAGATVEDEYGFLPFFLGNDKEDFANKCLLAFPDKYLIVNKDGMDENQVAAAKEFLNWLVYSEAGKKFVVEGCDLISAFTNNTYEVTSPLGKYVVEKMAAGETFGTVFTGPSNHWSILGAEMQKYIAGKVDRAGLAAAINGYWKDQA